MEQKLKKNGTVHINVGKLIWNYWRPLCALK